MTALNRKASRDRGLLTRNFSTPIPWWKIFLLMIVAGAGLCVTTVCLIIYAVPIPDDFGRLINTPGNLFFLVGALFATTLSGYALKRLILCKRPLSKNTF